MLHDIATFGGMAPARLAYFFAAMVAFAVGDPVVARLGVYRMRWHPPLARFTLFLGLLTALILATRP